MNAEMNRITPDQAAELQLQWGRVPMNAEIMVLLECGVTRIHASMGPRSNERGNGSVSPLGRRTALGFNGAAFQ